MRLAARLPMTSRQKRSLKFAQAGALGVEFT